MSDPHNRSCVSRLFPKWARALARAFLVGGLLAVLGCQGDALTPSVISIHIVAVPATDTLTLADWVFLTVRSDSTDAAPTHVTWTIFPGGDSTVSDTLWYHAKVAGTVLVQAVAMFDGGGIGVATRRVVTRPSQAPPVPTIVPLEPDDVEPVPIGDTIRLRGDVPASGTGSYSTEWFIGDTLDNTSRIATTGDTVQLAFAMPGTYPISFRVTNSAGAVATARYLAKWYDPITPATWRKRLSHSPISSLAQRPDGRLMISTAGMLGAYDSAGSLLWSVPGGGEIAVDGENATYTVPNGTLRRLAPDGTVSWSAAGNWSQPAIGADGLLRSEHVDNLLSGFDTTTVRAWSTTDSVVWNTRIPFFDPNASAIAPDSALYLVGSLDSLFSQSTQVMVAIAPGGSIRWTTSLNPVGPQVADLAIADDSTILALPNIVYALRPDGTIRWGAPIEGATRIVVGSERAFVLSATTLSAVALADGSIDWTVTLPAADVRNAEPAATANDEVVVPTGSYAIAYDAATGAERWRHQLAAPIATDLLLTADGTLILGDSLGYVEAIPLGAGPAASAWPMGGADAQRTHRAHIP